MYDVVIVGARCAGSALALMLAREGLKVLAIDRTTFPSDTMSGHFIHPAGVSCLRRLGLLEGLEALGAPAQETMTVDFGPVVLVRPAGAGAGRHGGRLCAAPLPVRPDAGRCRGRGGRELREGVSFVEPLVEDGRVAGIRTRNAAGATEDIRARLVVGADGKRSRFARMVGAQAYDRQPAATCMYYAYWSGFDTPDTRLFVRDGLFGVGRADAMTASPSSASPGRTPNLPVCAATSARPIARRQRRCPGSPTASPPPSRPERFVGTGDLDGFFRTASGPGWALLGDAGLSQGSDHRAGHDRRAARMPSCLRRQSWKECRAAARSMRALARLRPPPRRGGTADVRPDRRPRPPRAAAAGDERAASARCAAIRPGTRASSA